MKEEVVDRLYNQILDNQTLSTMPVYNPENTKPLTLEDLKKAASKIMVGSTGITLEPFIHHPFCVLEKAFSTNDRFGNYPLECSPGYLVPFKGVFQKPYDVFFFKQEVIKIGCWKPLKIGFRRT
ncbi:MAG TPA: hypothetical protein VKA70_21775 [Blastocatellia bacterium]|nr:hypothetical protein [Blastocatellia bacterium]